MHLPCLSVVPLIFIIHFTIIIIADGYSKAPPRLASSKTKSNSVIYLAGSKVQLQCPVYADPQRLIVEWMRNNVPVEHVHRYFVTLNGYLRIEFAQIEDSGVYTCKAVNGFGSVYANITLSILSEKDLSEKRFISVGDTRLHRNHKLSSNSDMVDAFATRYDTDGDYEDDLQSPRFLTPPTTKEIRKNSGKPLKLRCNVGGNPKPDVIWYKNGSPMNPSKLPAGSSQSEGILNIYQARVEDSGYYMCVASNVKGQINATFAVTISDKLNRPEIVAINPENSTVLLGQRAFFECQFRSKLEPLVKWLKQVTLEEVEGDVDENHGILIEIGSEYFKSVKLPVTLHKRDGIYYNRLILDSVNQRDSGKYLCSVVNYKGFAYRTSYLTVATSIEMNELRDLGLPGINYCTLTIIVVAIIGSIVVVIFFTFFLIDHREGRGGLGSGLRGRLIGRRLILSDPMSKIDGSVNYPILEERYHPSCYHHHVKHLQPPTPTFNQPSSSSSPNNYTDKMTTSNHLDHHHHSHHPSNTTTTSASTSQNHHHHHHHYDDYQRSSRGCASYQKIANAVVEKSSTSSTVRSLGVV